MERWEMIEKVTVDANSTSIQGWWVFVVAETTPWLKTSRGVGYHNGDGRFLLTSTTSAVTAQQLSPTEIYTWRSATRDTVAFVHSQQNVLLYSEMSSTHTSYYEKKIFFEMQLLFFRSLCIRRCLIGLLRSSVVSHPFLVQHQLPKLVSLYQSPPYHQQQAYELHARRYIHQGRLLSQNNEPFEIPSVAVSTKTWKPICTAITGSRDCFALGSNATTSWKTKSAKKSISSLFTKCCSEFALC